jgi:hypothetical protein
MWDEGNDETEPTMVWCGFDRQERSKIMATKELPFEIASITDAGRHVEARRSSLKAALMMARKFHREYRGAARIEVRWHGTVIADDPSDIAAMLRHWSVGKTWGMPR